jgi:hypothetical protein
MRFFVFFENGRREPVGGRRELVSHHGATGGGVRGPKMRHLVLYKLAGFFPTDWQPCSGGLCPQKRGHFCAKLCTNWPKMHAFSPKNPLFCTFLQGGRDDFLAGPKTGFLGVPGVARAAPPKTEFCFENSPSRRASKINQKMWSFAIANRTFCSFAFTEILF